MKQAGRMERFGEIEQLAAWLVGKKQAGGMAYGQNAGWRRG